jgi:hypothetical protein
MTPYKRQQKAKREAYLSTLRPEVRAQKMTKDEKAAQRYQQTQQITGSVSANTNAPVELTPAENRPAQPLTSLMPTNGVPSFTPNQGLAGTHTDPNALRLPPTPTSSPVPVTRPQNIPAADSAQSDLDKKMTANMITIDPQSLEGLATFNTNFGSYVDKLVNFTFPTIPEKIEMTGTHTVDVRVSGAAAFESLQKGVKDMINTAIDAKMAEIWKQTGGQIGSRPGTPPPKVK